MGKTRLLNELRREIQLGDGLFVEGSCWTGDGEGLGPFAPVVLQLATALGERSEAVRKYPDLIRAARDRSHESAAAAQLTEFLVRCAAEHPYVLYLSDLARGTRPPASWSSSSPAPSTTTRPARCSASPPSRTRSSARSWSR